MIIPGFRFAATAAGLKKTGALDLALMVADAPAAAAGVFTTNRVKAAPVVLSQERLRGGRAQAILVNAGNANACTGPEGLEDARETTAGRRRVAEDPGTPGAARLHRGHRPASPAGEDHPGPAQTDGPPQPPGFPGSGRGHPDHRHPAQDVFTARED